MDGKLFVKKQYEIATDRIFLVMFFMADFVLYLMFWNKLNFGEDAATFILVGVGLLFCQIAAADFIQTEGHSKNAMYLWGMLWFFGAGLILFAAKDYQISYLLAVAFVIISKFLLYFCGVRLLFSGYTYQISAKAVTALIILSGAFTVSLLIMPEALLLYLLVKNRKSRLSLISEKLYTAGMGVLGFTIFSITLAIAYYVYFDDSAKIPQALLYACAAAVFAEEIFFDALYRRILKKREKTFIGDNQYTLIFLAAGTIMFGLLYWYGLSAGACVTLIFLCTLAILFYLFADIYFTSEKWKGRRAAAMNQFEWERKKERDAADFLHDEVLQDLYAAKLLLHHETDNAENRRNVEEILEKLQLRIRGELEASGMNLEKSLSLKENISIMLLGLQKRFCEKQMEIEFLCDDDLIIHEPQDRQMYYFIKELGTNAFKHGGGCLSIHLKRAKSKVCLDVSSDGKVISEDEFEILSKGYGLASMKEQVLALGGEFLLIKNRDGGMTVSIKMKGE